MPEQWAYTALHIGRTISASSHTTIGAVLTFPPRARRRQQRALLLRVIRGRAVALRVQLPRLAQLAAVGALGYGAALLLDLEERPIGVVAVGRAVSFDAGFAGVYRG